MVDLTILPPGGGPPDEPEDPEGYSLEEVRQALALAKTEQAMLLAERLSPRARTFAEHFVITGDVREAARKAYPSLKTAVEVNKRAGAFLSDPQVKKYIELVRGYSGMSAGMTFSAVLLHLEDEATDPSNPGYVRVTALGMLASEMRQSGLAAEEGFAPPEKNVTGKRDAAALPGEVADEWLEQLSNSPPVPKAGGQG